jgi:hypothetical protein
LIPVRQAQQVLLALALMELDQLIPLQYLVDCVCSHRVAQSLHRSLPVLAQPF